MLLARGGTEQDASLGELAEIEGKMLLVLKVDTR